MVPTVTQQLRTMRRRFCDTILPALPAEAGFAQEQAKLMLATFDWLLDTHEEEYRYEVLENDEYRRLLTALAELLDPAGDDQLREEIKSCLAERGPTPDEASTPLAKLADQTHRLKEHTMQLASRLLDGPGAGAARRLLAQAANVQGNRELAYYRLTGFPQEAETLQSNLDAAFRNVAN